MLSGYMPTLELIDEDIKNSKIPIWHDESYWNWYYKDKNVRVLLLLCISLEATNNDSEDINILMEIKANIRPQVVEMSSFNVLVAIAKNH